MKTAEEWAKSEFDFLYIDDVEPQMKTVFGTTGLLKQIEAIQLDALRESAEIALKAIDENFHPNYHAAAMMIENAILARIKEVEG